ncbi:MAG: hypothetical protein HPZ91_16700 [Lentisphaeria bacterium]|nr:hypothetical protein [Lentisphaeria bacterium]
MATNAKFSSRKFIRTGGSVEFTEKDPQPSDFTEEYGYTYATEYAQSKTCFVRTYPKWKRFAACFKVRTGTITITGKLRCRTETFQATQMEKCMKPGYVDVEALAIPGNDRSSIPSGDFQLVSYKFTDDGNGYTDIIVTYKQNLQEELVKISRVVPSPKGNKVDPDEME